MKIDWYDEKSVSKATAKDCFKQLWSHDLCEPCKIALERLENIPIEKVIEIRLRIKHCSKCKFEDRYCYSCLVRKEIIDFLMKEFNITEDDLNG